MNIEDLLKEIQICQQQKSINLDELTPQNRFTMEGVVRQATDRYENLVSDFRPLLLKRVNLIFAKEKPAKADGLVLDGAAVYKFLAEPIEQSYGTSMHSNRTFTATQLSALYEGCYRLCKELNIKEMPAPKFKNGIYTKDFAAVVDTAKILIRQVMDDDLNKVWIEHNILKYALENNLTEVNVTVYSLSPEEQEGLSRLGTLTVTKEQEPTESEHKNKQHKKSK